MELPEGQDCRIVRYRQGVDVSNDSTWEDAFRWLIDEAERFHRVFSPRIKSLPLMAGDETDYQEQAEVGR